VVSTELHPNISTINQAGSTVTPDRESELLKWIALLEKELMATVSGG